MTDTFPVISTTKDNKPVYHLNNIPGFNEFIKFNYDKNSFESFINDKFLVQFDKIFTNSPTKQSYSLIRYNKNMLLNEDINTIGLLRSLIINSSGKVVSFSPPKSIDWNQFLTLYPENNENIIAEQFIEGTMINVFWDPNIGLSGSWEIATRSCVSAEIAFYFESGKPIVTFRTMFMEAVKEVGLDFNKLNPSYCYSFVLQHPLNRIVVPFSKPSLYLISIYEITQNDDGIINVYPIEINKSENVWSESSVKFPEIYKGWENAEELIETYASMNTNYQVLGIILKNLSTGQRCKKRNPVYENVRHLRGNQPKLMYHYLSLRKEGKVNEYLKFYPENKKEFAFFRKQLHDYTYALYNNYIMCYIKKQKPLKQFEDKYRTHMYNIHQIYINTLKEAGRHVSNSVVIEYVNNIHSSLLMYALNYDMRKRQVDILQAEAEAEAEQQ
jgi:hypothetical protein